MSAGSRPIARSAFPREAARSDRVTSIRPGMSTQKPGPTGFSAAMPALDNVLILAGVTLVLCLGFLFYVLLSGQLAVPIIQGTAVDILERNLVIWRKVFLTALWVLVGVGLVRHYRVDSVAWLVALGGVACWWLLPMMITSKAVGGAPRLMETAQSLIASLQASGGALIVIGVLRVVIGRVIAIAYTPKGGFGARTPDSAALSEIAEKRAKARPSLMRKCWELHFCRGSLRVTCPRFLEGISCWKKKSGCYCDHDLASQLLSTIAAKHRVQVAQELDAAQSRAEAYHKALAAKRQREARKKAGNPCRECPLYLEHQKYKYRTLAWGMYPLAALIVAFMLPTLRKGYAWLDIYLTDLLSQWRILPHKLSDAPIQYAPWLSAENAMIVMFGVLLLAVMLRLLEVGVFRLKL